MLVSNVHKSMIVVNSIDTRFSRNVLEAVQKAHSMCSIGSKTMRRSRVVLNPIKHSCWFFKHYLNVAIFFSIPQSKEIVFDAVNGVHFGDRFPLSQSGSPASELYKLCACINTGQLFRVKVTSNGSTCVTARGVC